MTKQQIIDALPKRVRITRNIIHKSDIGNAKNCIGANVVKKAFPHSSVSWVAYAGYIQIGRAKIYISTQERIDMMDVEKPRFVTLIQNTRGKGPFKM